MDYSGCKFLVGKCSPSGNLNRAEQAAWARLLPYGLLASGEIPLAVMGEGPLIALPGEVLERSSSTAERDDGASRKLRR